MPGYSVADWSSSRDWPRRRPATCEDRWPSALISDFAIERPCSVALNDCDSPLISIRSGTPQARLTALTSMPSLGYEQYDARLPRLWMDDVSG